MDSSSSPNIDREIMEAAATAFIDRNHPSQEKLRPSFISNDCQRGRKVSSVLKADLSQCSAFAFSVAFVTESGITPLLQTLKELELKNIPGRILATDYLAFSEPRALERLERFTNIEMRIFRVEGIANEHGFHTKGYLFENSDQTQSVIIGSSNLTASALSTNREWNLRFTSREHGELIREIANEFNALWELAVPIGGYLSEYRKLYEDKKRVFAQQHIVEFAQIKLEPNSMQTKFISNLEECISSGEEKALLISATGTGKTYASAFAIRRFDPRRILFLAHREQILKQAIKSYRRVLGDSRTLGLLSGNSNQSGADYLFATVQTMSKSDVLLSFEPQDFDIVVIDEVHRAGSNSYSKIIDYFEPQFYLGMTASPDRSDGFDIYGLFDNNIVYEIRLQKALEENLLCPFHYFGITDLVVDDEEVDELKLFQRLTSEKRVDYIIEQADFYGFSGDRVKGLIFCSTKREARELSRLFNERGLKTMFLSGDDSQELRENAIERLVANPGDPGYFDRIDYLLTVDIFNEGVDIPEVNQVIMLRPTESPIIFTQQLGRGLRKAAGKEYVVVLDFIGNYSNNYMIPIALSGDRSYSKDSMRKFVMEGDRTIPGCSSVHFDEVSRERIFRSIDESRVSMRLLKEKYSILKRKLGRIPLMVDFLNHGEIDPMLFVDKKKSYYRYLSDCEKDYPRDSLSEQEHLVLEFISRYCGNGMRPHELAALNDLLTEGCLSRSSLSKELHEYYAIDLTTSAFDSAMGVLDKSFVNAYEDKRKFDCFELVNRSGDVVFAGEDLLAMIENPSFKEALDDIISFGLARFEDRYRQSAGALKLYEKYSRKDACRLLNWARDDSATMYGYRIKHETCPIFVTYKKKADIASSTQYEDAFENQQTFSWMTRSRLTLESEEVRRIAEAEKTGLQIHLFVKKSDSEGGDFYYLGKAKPISWSQTTIKSDDNRLLPIVNFKLQLERAVRDDIYAYLSGNTPSSIGLSA